LFANFRISVGNSSLSKSQLFIHKDVTGKRKTKQPENKNEILSINDRTN